MSDFADELTAVDCAYADGLHDGADAERAAIVAWLRERPSGYYGGARVASQIKRGDHLAGDNE